MASFAIVLKWSGDTGKAESCKWLREGSGGPDRAGGNTPQLSPLEAAN